MVSHSYDSLAYFVGAVIAFQEAKQLRPERLHSQTYAIDPERAKDSCLVRADGAGISLHRKLASRPDGQPVGHGRQQIFELGWSKVSWRAAAQEQGVDRLRSTEG